jgi:hypothetical protein
MRNQVHAIAALMEPLEPPAMRRCKVSERHLPFPLRHYCFSISEAHRRSPHDV